MAHEASCGEATLTPRTQCGCHCGGRLHGVPHSERGRAFYEPAAEQANVAAVRTAAYRSDVESAVTASGRRLKVADFLGAVLTENAIRSQFQLNPFIDDITAAVTERLATAVLSDADQAAIRRRFRTEHLFCTLAVCIVRAYDAADDVVVTVRNAVVERVLDLAFGAPGSSVLSGAGRAAVRTALRAGVDAGVASIKQAVGAEEALTTVRFLGVLACPDVDRHPQDSVARYCLLPLVTAYLTPQAQALVQGWVGNRFQGAPPL